MSDSQRERRKHPRVDGNIPLKISAGDFDIVTETANVSCAGAYCKVNKNFEPMTKLEIHLLLPLKKRNKTATRQVTCEGVIVRSEEAPDGNAYNVAIFFSHVKDKDLKALSEYVNSTLEAKKKSVSS